MATVSTPEQAMVQIANLTRKQDNPNDKGLLVSLGQALLDAAEHLEGMVWQSGGKAQKGTVTVKIPLHAYKDAMGEIKLKLTNNIDVKLPSQYSSHDGEFYLGDGVLSTSPIAKRQEKMFAPEVIEGGNAMEAPKERKAGKAI